MASGWDALLYALIGAGWPGLLAVSGYAVWSSVRFYRSVRRSAPGLLVLLTVVGWVTTLVGVALVSTFYLVQSPQQAGPVVLPVFLLWAGSMVVIVYVVQRWGHEAVALDAYYGELEQMERMKTRFINHVAHELNTPIMPLRIQAQMLADGTLGPLQGKQKQAVDVIGRNLDRLSYLVELVVLASRLQADRVEFKPEAVSLAKLVEAVIPEGMEVRGTVDEDLAVVADGRWTGFIAEQVVGHAVREEAPWIEVEAEGRLDEARLRFRFPGEHGGDPRFFEAFHEPAQLDRTEQYVGLELFIARGLASAQGGRLRSLGENGTEVIELTLPLA